MFICGVSSSRLFLTSAATVLIVYIGFVSGDLEPILKRCCSSGETWASNHTTCTGPPQDSMDIPQPDRLTCLTSLYICCIRMHRRQNCEKGKEMARSGRQCFIWSQPGAETYKDCCDGCALGIQAGVMRMPCVLSTFNFGSPWDEAFVECCETSSSVQGTSALSGKSRCDVDNSPCSQKCEEIGNQIRCSCYPGYTLASDQRTCADIDECALRTSTCNPVTEVCINSIGGFQCREKIPAIPGQCPQGYVKNQETNTCDDVDECSMDVCPRSQICINSIGSYTCVPRNSTLISSTCPLGFKLQPETGRCIDVDECAEGTYQCESQEICQNSHGGYNCIPMPSKNRNCPAGFKWSDNKANCEDTDECAEGSHTCNPNTHNCVNAIGSFRCVPKIQCPHGYQWSRQGNKCEDVNECGEGIDDCDPRTHYCVNTPGSYQCQTRVSPQVQRCGTGYTYDANTEECIDINECELLRPCQSEQICENTIGSYRCTCPLGYIMDSITRQCKDINECQLNLHSCAVSQRCDNTIGSYTCVRTTSCGTGYTLNAASSQCEDDDECQLNTHNCGPGFVCRNIKGSFRCDRVKCPPGQKLLSDGSCKVVNCGKGMETDDVGDCLDINECSRTNVCRANQVCINTVGSYRCQNLLNCGPGFELNEVGNQCIDVDECARRIDECGPQQTCRNRPGFYTCECPRGYTLNAQRECEDIDECTRFRGQVCSSISECINTQGSYVCNCKDGFRKADDDKNCVDVDECAESPNICHHTCNNVWGSYQCTCRQGYTLSPDGRTCQDMDECKMWEGRGNLCIGFCVNEPGSFSCSCPDGYRLSSDQRTCQDIDECQEQNVCSEDKEVCLNTRGGFKCNRIACPPNYVRDKDHRKQSVNSDDTVVCRKKCAQNDIDCILNATQTVTFQTLALPTIPYLPEPLILTTMRAVTSQNRLMTFHTDYEILDGNSNNLFDVLKGQGVGSLRLVKPIHGPLEMNLKVLMMIHLNPNQRSKFTSSSRHLAMLQIIVSEYDF